MHRRCPGQEWGLYRLMRIVINGAGFVNKGAEAMVRTVQAELAKRLPDVEFYLWRTTSWDREPALSSGLNPVSVPFEVRDSLWSLFGGRVAKSLWSVSESFRTHNLKLIRQAFRRKYSFVNACKCYLTRTVEDFDAFIDISGFAYGDAWGMGAFERVCPIVDYCREHGKPAIFLPQAWGSFDKPQIRRRLCDLLTGRNTVFYSRDQQSSAYLEKALDKAEGSITPHPDIVFGFRGGTQEEGEQILRTMGCSTKRPLIGIAPNMRVYERVRGAGTGNAYLQALVKLIQHCLEHHDVDIVLQANEVNTHGVRKDDRYLCSLVAASVGRSDRCFVIREPLTAEASMALIGRLEFLVGSRFHSLVFGFSQGVPAMALSWSHKYRELFSLFGVEDSVQECQDIDSEVLIAAFERNWSQRQRQRSLILERVEQLRARVSGLFDEVSSMIDGARGKHNV